MKHLAALVIASCLALAGCTSDMPGVPSDTTSGIGESNVQGRVIERYGEAAIPNATVFANDGIVTVTATTTPDGRFSLRGLRQTPLVVIVHASGFTSITLEKAGPNLGDIGLAPIFAGDEWTGHFPEPGVGNQSERITPFVTTHRGPVTVSFRAGCQTQSTTGPFWAFIFRGIAIDSGQIVMRMEWGSFVDRDYSQETILPPGPYVARLVVDNQARNDCAWAVMMRHPA